MILMSLIPNLLGYMCANNYSKKKIYLSYCKNKMVQFFCLTVYMHRHYLSDDKMSFVKML